MISNSELARQEKSVSAKLAKEKKIPILIVPDSEDKNWHGMINGVRYSFPKGMTVEVPESIYLLIRQSAQVIVQSNRFKESNKNKDMTPK